MGQSLAQNYLHIIFSTKNRTPHLNSHLENELYKYLGGICKRLQCYPIKIGGHLDHVHILCQLSKKIPLVKLLEELKSHSSKWVKSKGDNLINFYWQDGYGAFSVGSSELGRVSAYIDGQHEHHKLVSFQDEYRNFLKDCQVSYDEQFVWD